MAGLVIRDAGEADIPAVCAIYNHAVARTTAIWNDRTVDPADRLAWWQGRKQAGYPLLVAVDASGGLDPRTEAAAWSRITAEGGRLSSVVTLAAELAGDFTSELGGQTLGLMYRLIG